MPVHTPHDPNEPEKYRAFFVTKHSAAQSQLETAIQLWFNEGDPVAIHTLAVAAHDCFNALVKNATGKPSEIETWIKTKSKGFQKRILEAQNFFKHGQKDLKATFHHVPIYSEMLMMECVKCYERLNGKRNALMRVFTNRFLFEHPETIEENFREHFMKNIGFNSLADSSRLQFFAKMYPHFSAVDWDAAFYGAKGGIKSVL